MAVPDLPLHYAAVTDTLPDGMLENMLAGLELYLSLESGLVEHFGKHAALYDEQARPPGLAAIVDYIRVIREALPRTSVIGRALYLAMASRYPDIQANINTTHPSHPMIPARVGGRKFFDDLAHVTVARFLPGTDGMTSAEYLAEALRLYTLAQESAGLDTLWQ